MKTDLYRALNDAGFGARSIGHLLSVMQKTLDDMPTDDARALEISEQLETLIRCATMLASDLSEDTERLLAAYRDAAPPARPGRERDAAAA